MTLNPHLYWLDKVFVRLAYQTKKAQQKWAFYYDNIEQLLIYVNTYSIDKNVVNNVRHNF